MNLMMAPSRLHHNHLNEAEFIELCPEHTLLAKPIAQILDQLACRRRCKNELIQADLVVSHARILELERHSEFLSKELYDKYSAEDCDDDTAIMDITK